MRWVAAVLASVVSVLQLTLFAVAQAQLRTAGSAVGLEPEPSGLRWIWIVAWSLPWLIGAILLVADRQRLGVAVILTAGVLSLTSSLGALAPLFDGSALSVSTDVADLVAVFGGALLWILMLVAMGSALALRPPGPWRIAAPGPVGPYVAASVLAWLPAVFETTAFAPPEAMRAFITPKVAELAGLDVAANLAAAGAIALVLFVACRLRPDVGGAVLLTFAVPRLLAELDAVVRVTSEEFVIFTPAGVLGLAGLAGAVAIGVVWVTAVPRVEVRSD